MEMINQQIGARSKPDLVQVTRLSKSNSSVTCIAVGESDDEIRSNLSRTLDRAGYDVWTVRDRAELEVLLNQFENDATSGRIDLVVFDIRLVATAAANQISTLQREGRFPPFVVITAYGNLDQLVLANELKPIAIFDTPFDTVNQLARIRQLVPHQKRSGFPSNRLRGSPRKAISGF